MSRRLLGALVVLAVVVGGCGDDDDTQAVAGGGTAEATEPDEATTTTTVDEPDGGPERPLELRPVLALVLPMDDDAVPDGCRTPSDGWTLDGEVHAAEVQGGEVVSCYLLGPTELTQEIVANASADVLDLGLWSVSVTIRDDRMDAFNALTAECFAGAPACPTRQLAILSDGNVVSAPSINAPSFDARISITGDLDRAEAEALADRLG